jgi:Trk K+ transport system NAD-binding subunit
VLLLVVVYAIGITGMTLLPGEDAAGNPQHMSLFHAFYFLTYTATTTGFGEIPGKFSEAQRLWAIVCLYMGVIAWLYAIGSIFRLVQNPHFVQALAERKFARSVKRFTQPFFVICGFGDTGSLLARGLSDEGWGGSILDSDPERIKALGLRDYQVKMVGVCADASVPKHLLDAGIKHPHCQGVVALTSDEHINLKIAVMARFLNPNLRIICRSTDQRHQEELAMLEFVQVVDPFQTFADQLSVALQIPQLYTLMARLVGAREVKPIHPPLGTWILCGYGRMGRHLYSSLKTHAVPLVVIDPQMDSSAEIENKIIGHTTDKTLREAGVEEAVGIVAGTDSDSNNLTIMLRARYINNDIFLIVRQNNHENEVAFNAADANLIMQPSLVTARRILLMLISPLIEPLLDYLREHQEALLETITKRLKEVLGNNRPQLWSVDITASSAPAVLHLQDQGFEITLGAIYSDLSKSSSFLDCVPLVLKREGETVMLPADSQILQTGDHILFCGKEAAQGLVEANLNNVYALKYLLTGFEAPRGYFFRWLSRRATR